MKLEEDNMSVKQYVDYYLALGFFPEHEIEEVPGRSTDAALATLPKSAFAFRFYEATVVQVDDETLVGRAKNHSGMYYPGGKIFTTDELNVAYPGDDNRILRSNCEYNGGRLVLCRAGNWQIFHEGDQILEERVK